MCLKPLFHTVNIHVVKEQDAAICNELIYTVINSDTIRIFQYLGDYAKIHL